MLDGRRAEIDATFPDGAAWDGHSPLALACGPGEGFPAGDDPDVEKRALEQQHCDPVVREPFIAALTRAGLAVGVLELDIEQPIELIAQAGETVGRIVLRSADCETEPLVLPSAPAPGCCSRIRPIRRPSPVPRSMKRSRPAGIACNSNVSAISRCGIARDR